MIFMLLILFYYRAQTINPGVTLHTVSLIKPSRKCSTDLPTGKSYGGIFSDGCLFLNASTLCLVGVNRPAQGMERLGFESKSQTRQTCAGRVKSQLSCCFPLFSGERSLLETCKTGSPMSWVAQCSTISKVKFTT